MPDGAKQNAANCATRVGLHAPDRSYVQFYFGNLPSAGVNANVSVEYSAGDAGNPSLAGGVQLWTPRQKWQAPWAPSQALHNGVRWFSSQNSTGTRCSARQTPPCQ